MLRQEELRELVAEFRSPPRSWKGQPRSAACQTISSYMRRDFHPLDVDHAGIVARYVAGPEAASWAGAVSRPI